MVPFDWGNARKATGLLAQRQPEFLAPCQFHGLGRMLGHTSEGRSGRASWGQWADTSALGIWQVDWNQAI